jgi:nitroreductase
VDTFEAVRNMLAVRQFQDMPILLNVVREIVEAAHLSASSNNGQPWHFVVVQNTETLRRFGSLVPSGPYIAQAPLAVVASTAPSPFGESDVSRAIQDMMPVAWSHGVGSNWTGFHGLAAMKRVVGPPDD